MKKPSSKQACAAPYGRRPSSFEAERTVKLVQMAALELVVEEQSPLWLHRRVLFVRDLCCKHAALTSCLTW
eukprot:CAMPEP_0172844810 /NCGR_PEP_ID=MMETSP1075-20121228/32497_1 /TAXON_ID=2916 /ORGANISM="Ceratium fusus, Strain PA161109" /LENGTH=70 /DNA_ID=CAMNT_0013689333 /DNA_START=166 /DNA_END=375 /DNA_ORIENTATION=-